MQNIATVALLLVVGIAVLKDMQAHRIPNLLTLSGAIAGLSFQTLEAGAPGLLSSVAGIAAGIAVLLPFYLLRGMGAGDVKLMGAVGSFLGAKPVLIAACATLGIGAILGLAILASRKLSQPGISVRKEKFPYAVAIAGGSVVSLAHVGQLHRLAGSILGWSGT